VQEEFQHNKRRAFSLKLQQRSGQLLIEAMVAISVMVIGLLGIFALLSQSLGLYHVAADQYVAANLAAEGIEVVKNILDANFLKSGMAWNEGLAVDGAYGVNYNSTSLDSLLTNKNLLFDETNKVYNYTTGRPTTFQRIITIKNISPDEIQVDSEVRWKTRGGLSSKISLEDHFYNWR